MESLSLNELLFCRERLKRKLLTLRILGCGFETSSLKKLREELIQVEAFIEIRNGV